MSYNGGSDDPTGFDGSYPVTGVLPVTSKKPRKDKTTNASNAAQAAGARAFTAQALAFYFRSPAKAFFRTRVDYLAYARTLQQQNAARATDATSRRLVWLRSTTPGVIASAVRHYGWKVIPEQILPPLIANVTVGSVLYVSYLQILGHLHEESAAVAKRVFPPPSPSETFTAGFLAGSIQSIVAAPLDAIQIRYERYHPHLNNGKAIAQPQSMWTFGKAKLQEIGARGIFAGYSLSLVKDAFGSAVFFSTFEYVKAQGYYNFIRWYYGSLQNDVVDNLALKRPHTTHSKHAQYPETSNRPNLAVTPGSTARPNKTITPHYAIEPAFLFLAGISASIVQSTIIYPLHHLQIEHWEHLEALDQQATKLSHHPRMPGDKKWAMMRNYYKAYQLTWQDCKDTALRESQGKVGRWLYRGFLWNTLRQLPSTSAGLIIFELVRRKYGLASDEVRITSQAGQYDILVT